MAAHGIFYWAELNTGDVEKAKIFFGETIGWTFKNQPIERGDYWVAYNGDIPIAGIVSLDAFAPVGTPPHWFSYLAVDDVDRRVEAAAKAGAQILRGPFDVEDVGRIAILIDPSGAAMGWMTPAARG